MQVQGTGQHVPLGRQRYFKYQRGPVGGVSCSELTYYQYHALRRKGFSHFPLQHLPQLLCFSFWCSSCITV